MWLSGTAKKAVPHGFQYRTYARQARGRPQDLNDVSAVADRWRLQKGERRRNLSTTARVLARRSSALGERVVESAVGACRGEHGGLIGVECGVWTVSRSAGDPLSFSIRYDSAPTAVRGIRTRSPPCVQICPHEASVRSSE